MRKELFKRVISVVFACLILLSVSSISSAHSGRTDANGGHWDRKSGTYHYHNGGGSSGSSSSSSSSKKTNSSGSSKSSSDSTKSGGSISNTNVPKNVYATKVNVSNMPTSLKIGEEVELDGNAYPADCEDKEIIWETSDASVANVDDNGKLTAISAGTAVISAKTSRGTTSKYTVTIKEVEAERISIEGGNREVLVGENIILTSVFLPENTTNKDVEWRSNDENVATVDENGNLIAVAAGDTTITVIHKDLTASIDVEVKPVLAESVAITYLEETVSDVLSFEIGEMVEFSAVVLPDGVTDKTIKWSVDNIDVAKIDANGVLTALTEGVVAVTAETSDFVKDTVEIEIHKPSFMVNAIATIIVILLCGGIIGGPVCLIVWLWRKFRKK